MLGKTRFYKIFDLLAILMGVVIGYGQIPACTELNFPIDGAVGVSITTDLEWQQVMDASGYILSVGTSSGGTEILNAVDVGDVDTYDFANNLPSFQMIYVTITPYDGSGNFDNCPEEVFTTGGAVPPLCTEIINPTDGDDLVSVTANITWIRDFGASGYRMTIRENDPNGIIVLNNEDVGNGTNFKPPDFKPRTLYFVTIVPYNDFGPATGCNPISFTTGDGPPLPFCTELLSPEDGSVDVPVDADLQWAAVTNVDGYFISLGTTPRGTDIVNQEDVGNVTTYQLSENLPIGQRIYAFIIPYEGQLRAENCIVTSFTVTGPSSDDVNEIVPNFFTPNNDSFNDEWVVRSSQNTTVLNVYIFDRFGKLLKQLAPDQSWDGTVNGRQLPPNTYWFAIDVLNAPPLRGYFMLKR